MTENRVVTIYIPCLHLKNHYQHKRGGIIIDSNHLIINKHRLLGSAPRHVLKGCLPNGEYIQASFDGSSVILQANFKITISRHIVSPGDKIIIPKMSGRHTLGIDSIVYTMAAS